jgi:hypothetical protein
MNTANLQIEGMLLALSALTRMLRDKGIVDTNDRDVALREAEQSARSDRGHKGDISPSNVEAILFPIRFLQLAQTLNAGEPHTFTKIAAAVGGAPRPFSNTD